MTMRSYDDIEFRPWYLPDTARWLKLSLGARGLIAELLRKLDRHGRIALGEDPAADLAVILRLDEGETRKALTELLGAGRLVWDPVACLLSDPDLPARMRLGSAARMAKKRERDAARTQQPANDVPSQPVTPVTSGATPSPSDLPLISSGSDLSKADQEIPPVPTREASSATVVHSGDSMPDDARSKLEGLTQMRALRTPPDEVWAKFCNHFTGQHFPSRERLIARWDTWVRDQWGFDDKARRGRGSGGGPRGDRQGLDGWKPPSQATGTDGNPFGGDS